MANMFKMLDFTREGPGIGKNGPEKRRFFLFFEVYFNKFWDIMKLNLIYILFCIPIVTIGPATCAATYVLRNFARGEHAFVWSDFIDQFKKNFVHGLILELLTFFSTALLGYAVFYYYGFIEKGGWFYTVGCGVTLIGLLFLIFASYYCFLFTVTFKYTIKQTVKNSFIFASVNALTNVGVLIFHAMIILLCIALALDWYTLGIMLIVLVMIVPATMMFIQIFMIYPCVDRYLVKPAQVEEQRRRLAEEKAGKAQSSPVFSDTVNK